VLLTPESLCKPDSFVLPDHPHPSLDHTGGHCRLPRGTTRPLGILRTVSPEHCIFELLFVVEIGLNGVFVELDVRIHLHHVERSNPVQILLVHVASFGLLYQLLKVVFILAVFLQSFVEFHPELVMFV